MLGGRPPAYPEVPSDWDALGGFVAGDDVVAVRREEDVAAMAVLESGYRWLDFSDHQYLAPGGPARSRPTWRPSSAATIAELDPTSVFFPMGLGNPDHVMVHEACLLVREEQPDREWFCYEDHGYKHIPGLLAWRVAKLLRSHPWPTPAIVPHVPDEERKRRAIWCYTSQIPPLERDHALTRTHGGPGPRAVLAAGPAAAGVGGARRLHLSAGAERPARGEYGRVVRRTSVTAEVFAVGSSQGPAGGRARTPGRSPPHTARAGRRSDDLLLADLVHSRARLRPTKGTRGPPSPRHWPGAS